MRKLLFVLCITMYGCAQTSQLMGTLNSDFRGVKYENIVIGTSISNLEYSSKIQSAFCQEFTKRKIKCHEYRLLFPLSSRFTSEQTAKIFRENNVDAYLAVFDGIKPPDLPYRVTLIDVDTGLAVWTAHFLGPQDPEKGLIAKVISDLISNRVIQP